MKINVLYLFLFISFSFYLSYGHAIQYEMGDHCPNTDEMSHLDENVTKQKDILICFYYKEDGELSKITIHPNNKNSKTASSTSVKLNRMQTLIDMLIDQSQKGIKLDEQEINFGRFYHKISIYKKVIISLRIVGKDDDEYLVSFGEITFRD